MAVALVSAAYATADAPGILLLRLWWMVAEAGSTILRLRLVSLTAAVADDGCGCKASFCDLGQACGRVRRRLLDSRESRWTGLRLITVHP